MLSKDSATELLFKPEANSKRWAIKPLCHSLSHHYLAIANTLALQFSHFFSSFFLGGGGGGMFLLLMGVSRNNFAKNEGGSSMIIPVVFLR